VPQARSLVAAVVLLLLTVLGGCGDDGPPPDIAAPELGACRRLTPSDVARPSDDSGTVACTSAHTAETFAIGQLPQQLARASYDDEELGAWAYGTCSKAFQQFLGADDSLVMRTVVSWAWFRPSKAAWDAGARWYRCDVVGGADGAKTLRPLPAQAQGLFTTGQPDAWLTCARGATVPSSTKVPCSETHDWRAISTIKVGQPGDPYPGDRIVQVRSRDLCSDWIGAWSHYPADFDYGFTWFHEAEWKAGNRRSICWARTAG